MQYFDTVMTGCCKPGFFTDRNLLFAVSEHDSRLNNTDGGAPILPIDQADLLPSIPSSTADMAPGHVRTPPDLHLSWQRFRTSLLSSTVSVAACTPVEALKPCWNS